MERTPPRALPRGYRELWEAVDTADRGAGSRAEAARRLGVSTHTLQRILVDGNVPDFRRAQSRRLVLSWVRTLANLAGRFGREPRDWIEAVGIDWDDQVRSAATGARRRGRGIAGSSIRAHGDPMAAIRAAAESGESAPVRAAVAARPLLGDPLPGRGLSFLQACTERLVGAVDPRWGVQWESGSPARVAGALAEPGTGLHLAVGLFETAQLRGRGLDFLPLPGWRIAFRALRVGPAGVDAPAWEEIDRPGPARDGLRFMVRDGDPGEWIVRRQWEVPSAGLLVRDRSDPDALAEELFEEARRRDDRGVVLVADVPTVEQVSQVVAGLDGFRPEWDVAQIAPPRRQEPRYPLALAVRADARDWLRVLAHAWRDEVIGASPQDLARLYAEVIAHSLPPGTDGVSDGTMFPLHFDGALPAFAPALWNALLPRIVRRLSPPLDLAPAWDRALRGAYALSPPEWRPVLEHEASVLRREALHEAGEEPRPFHSFCRSCSASLLESPGPSECYCCYCTDGRGHLRPRSEVQRSIAQWMRTWQEGLAEEESMERAERYMKALPAWTQDDTSRARTPR